MTAPPRQTMLATAPVSKLIWTFAIPAILSQVEIGRASCRERV